MDVIKLLFTGFSKLVSPTKLYDLIHQLDDKIDEVINNQTEVDVLISNMKVLELTIAHQNKVIDQINDELLSIKETLKEIRCSQLDKPYVPPPSTSTTSGPVTSKHKSWFC